MCSW
jgi:hypothetical protein